MDQGRSRGGSLLVAGLAVALAATPASAHGIGGPLFGFTGGLAPPLWVAALVVGAFAIFHGHSHGTEIDRDAGAVAYTLGFVIATGVLHLCGIGFGLLSRWPAGRMAVRAAGGAIAMAGMIFLSQL